MILKVSTSYTHAHILFAIYDQNSLPSIGFSHYKLEDCFSWRPSVPFFLPNVASKPFHRLRSLLLSPLWATEHIYHATELDLILLQGSFITFFNLGGRYRTRKRHGMRSKMYWRYARTYKQGLSPWLCTINTAFSQIWKWNLKFLYISFSVFLPFFTCI